MKISVLCENVQVEGSVTKVVLSAEVKCNDPRELPLVTGLFTVVGYSTCSKDDKFDSLLGKRLARSRAYRTLYKKVRAEYFEAMRNLDISLRITEETMEKYTKAIDAQDRDIDRLIENI